VIHDRDIIYSEGVDRTLSAMGLTVLRTPVRAPQANAFCKRLVGTIRRECLDIVIPSMSGISDGLFRCGSRITIAAGPTAGWDWAAGSSA
jgi:hypothetical protein